MAGVLRVTWLRVRIWTGSGAIEERKNQSFRLATSSVSPPPPPRKIYK